MVWMEESRELKEMWGGLAHDWQGAMDQMTAMAATGFDEVAARGQAASSLVSQTWQQALGDMSGQVADWGEQLTQTLAKVASAWTGAMGGVSGGGGWQGFMAPLLDFGGWFHQGGIVAAHQGMVVSPGAMMPDEQLILAQSGEGILPRESMARLGEQNFEALRRGQFEVSPGGEGARYDITIQVQSLDAQGVAGLNWDRLVARHLLPALEREAGRRW
jgi:hypothetical protein